MIIAVDFDGTIVEHRYPEIGEEIPHAVETLRFLHDCGHSLILWTFRSGKELDDAVQYCKKHGLEFDAVNKNLYEEEYNPAQSRKIYADIYIDDRNIGGLPDWPTIFKIIDAAVK